MAALFCDVDGTMVSFEDGSWLPGVLEQLQAWVAAGHQLIITTRRDDSFIPPRVLKQWVADMQRLFPGCIVLTGIHSPRVLINDDGAICVNHETNAPWKFDLLKLARKK
jgi:hypothetical protein